MDPVDTYLDWIEAVDALEREDPLPEEPEYLQDAPEAEYEEAAA